MIVMKLLQQIAPLNIFICTYRENTPTLRDSYKNYKNKGMVAQGCEGISVLLQFCNHFIYRNMKQNGSQMRLEIPLRDH